MKYTAQDENQVANIARGKAECYICHKTLIKSCILSYKVAVLSVIVFTPIMCSIQNLLYKAEKPSVRPSRLYLDVSELIDFKLSQARITKLLGTRSFFLKVSKCFLLPSGEL